MSTSWSPAEVPPIRYRLLDSIRAFALEEMTDAGLSERARAAHAAWFADKARFSTLGGAQQSPSRASRLRAGRTRQHRRGPVVGRHPRPALSLSLVNGFGWAWVVLGDSRGAQRILTALDSSARGARPAIAPVPGCSLPGSKRRPADLDVARQHIAAASEVADATHDADLQARCSYYLAYVVSHRGEFRRALELTDRSRALYDQLERPWDQAASSAFRRASGNLGR